LSFDTCLSQDAIAEPPGVLLRVNGPQISLPDVGCFNSRWLPFPDLTSTNPAAFNVRITSAQVILAIVNLPLGFVNAANWRSRSMGSDQSAVAPATARRFLMALGK
jgi:hypothetical protein